MSRREMCCSSFILTRQRRAETLLRSSFRYSGVRMFSPVSNCFSHFFYLFQRLTNIDVLPLWLLSTARLRWVLAFILGHCFFDNFRIIGCLLCLKCCLCDTPFSLGNFFIGAFISHTISILDVLFCLLRATCI